MKFEEYMKRRMSKGITGVEVRAFGLKDMSSGWPKRYKDLEILPVMLHRVVRNFKRMNTSQLTKTRIENMWKEYSNYEISNRQYLYVMINDLNLIKIGISIDPYQRAKQLSNTSGIQTTVLAIYDVDQDVSYVERQLHKTFRKFRKMGEWFSNDVSMSLIEEQIPCNFKIIYNLQEIINE